MKQVQNIFEIHTQGQGLYEFSREVCDWSGLQNITCGLLTLFIRQYFGVFNNSGECGSGCPV